MSACPCGSGRDLNDCCAPLHYGRPAPTAEALMRSRYTAFALGNMEYLDKTCTTELRAESAAEAGGPQAAAKPQWLGLKILRTVGGGETDDTGQVEFVVQYKLNGQTLSRHELSDFRRIDGNWVFTASEFNPKQKTVVNDGKVGRNDPCPCGSQKKYKKCCGASS